MSDRFKVIELTEELTEDGWKWGVFDTHLVRIAPFDAEEDAHLGMSEMITETPEDLDDWYWVDYEDDKSPRFIVLQAMYQTASGSTSSSKVWGVHDADTDKFVPFGFSEKVAKENAKLWNQHYSVGGGGDPTREGWVYGFIVPEEAERSTSAEDEEFDRRLVEYLREDFDTEQPEAVNHPAHYQAGGLEAIDVLDAYAPDNPNIWNVLKYVLRHNKKGGTEDLEKAAWYLQREIDRRKEIENV